MISIELENMMVLSVILIAGVTTFGVFVGAYNIGLLGWLVL